MGCRSRGVPSTETRSVAEPWSPGPEHAADLFTQGGHGLGQFVGDGGGGTQILNRIAALGDGLVGTIESLFESFLRSARRKQIVCRLEMEHQPLKTLQQRVVQFAGDPGSFGQPLFKLQSELGLRQSCALGATIAVITQAVIKNAAVATMASGFSPWRGTAEEKVINPQTATTENASEVTKPALRDTKTTTIR